MNMEDFIARVKEMRALQRDYFRYRSSALLSKCKELEREVDRMIEDFENGEQPEQGRLW